jgi:flagellar protein FliO/FliZ
MNDKLKFWFGLLLAGACYHAGNANAAGINDQAETELPQLLVGGENLTDYFQVFLSLGVVVAVILACAWALKRFTRIGVGSGNLRVVGGLSVGPRERVVLVQAGDTQMLIGVAQGCVSRIHTFDQPIAPVAPEVMETSFMDQLNQCLKKAKVARHA